jgi:Carboxypeptidase regulatory-like domain
MLLSLMNRTPVMRIVVAAMLYFAACDVSAQQRPVPKGFSYPEGSQTIQIEISAGALAGLVTDPNGGPLSDVLVERMGAKWTNRSAAVFSDSRGIFRLSRMPNGVYYVKLSKPDFSTLKVKVRIRNESKSRLRLRLPLGI